MQEKTKKLIELDKQCLWHPFTQMKRWLGSEPVVIESGDGFYLIDTEGNRYIDGVSSLWCNVHGHRVKKIDDAIKDQLGKISHSTLLGLAQTKSIEFAEKLVAITPKSLKKVFYSDSGATSVEIALKIAYQYYHNKGEKRDKFIALRQSYHGDTIGSVSIGGIEVFHSIFKPMLFETYFVPAPFPYRFDGTAEQCRQFTLDKIEELLKKNSERIAAVVVEPLVQGAAGIIVHPKGFLKGVRELTKKYGVFLIADEVATGFGRTGKMFACENEQVEPDIMCLAKGITGGYLPLAATVAKQEIFDAFLGQADEFKTFYHGHTYTGNALGCAAAIASLELFEENRIIESLPEKINLIAEYLKEISILDFVGDVRQCGLMAGIEIVKDKKSKKTFDYKKLIGTKVCAAMRRKGAMMRPLSDVIVLMPPVAIDLPLLRKLLDIVYDTIKNDLPKIAGKQ
ncbi:MAG: adenosylmethionine--8-amino-7-oxononanoate transaminase [Planctomycetes bacterium]|nr:adenosylmethionine--8-amino-7-oxononanoate transaminase [Planctomycetota bacterium]MBU1517354.1 adenosylmethionine--8-amino-7-oxononanoate transaminase [Planctomycetota bacterium]MBU2457687.1 adenosylmethionine--8-amino-7-oxononanoate transaminase [Planctomycetota bacterium]MBU2597193.1 adenosylmethionine--8-amino-7-oxononanoate transaminase [Planctomycetota bacterium]